MAPKTKAPKREAKVTADYIDLSLRIRDDGGPTYSALASIGDPYARGDRVRQLLYLGLIAERGPIGAGIPHMPPLAPPVPAAPSEQQQRAPSPAIPELPNNTLFDGDDLAAIFGSHNVEAQGV